MASKKKEIKTLYVAIGCLFRTVASSSSATEFSISKSSHEILLVKRIEKRLPEIDNMWELPGGKIEPNELPSNAVEREFLEETGYRVKAVALLDRVYTVIRDYPEFRQQTFVTCYQCELLSDKKYETKPDSKVGEVRWFNFNEVDYLKTLVGSREFIVDVATRLSVHIERFWDKTTS